MGAAASAVSADVEALKAEGKSSKEIREALQAKQLLPPELDAKSIEELESEYANTKPAGSEGAQCATARAVEVDIPEPIELSKDESFGSAQAIVTACATKGVTGTLNLGMNISDEDREEGWLKKNGLSPLNTLPDLPKTLLITVLVLKKNALESIPELALPPSVQELDLSENQLASLPAMPAGLTSLDISENRLSTLPSNVGELTGLATIIAFKNEFSKLPDEIGNCVNLTEVNFFNNKLLRLPPTFSNCAALEILNVGGNKLKTLPDTSKWTAMKEMKCHQNGLMKIPSFAGMTQLECLKMDFNKALDELPELGEHKLLTQFEVGNCNLSKLPPSMTTWESLVLLNCAKNKITELPPLALPALEILNCGSNDITAIPKEVGGCKALKTLFFEANHITAVPAELLGLEGTISRINCGEQKTPGLTLDETLEKLKEVCTSRKGRFIGL